MSRNKLIFVFVAFLITIGIVFFLPKFFSECDYADGGFRPPGSLIRYSSCNCTGIKIGSDKRSLDGDMNYRCFGLVTSKKCEVGRITEEHGLEIVSATCNNEIIQSQNE